MKLITIIGNIWKLFDKLNTYICQSIISNLKLIHQKSLMNMTKCHVFFQILIIYREMNNNSFICNLIFNKIHIFINILFKIWKLIIFILLYYIKMRSIHQNLLIFNVINTKNQKYSLKIINIHSKL